MKRMRKVGFSILALIILAVAGVKPGAQTSAATPANLAKSAGPHPPSRAPFVETYGKLPLAFEVNEGQTDSRVKFLSRGGGYTLFLTESEAVLSLRKAESVAPTFRPARAGLKSGTTKSVDNPTTDKRPQTSDSVVRMKLAGANPNATATGINELPGKTNYFIGNDPKKWRTNVPTYAKVKYSGVYPGVDLVYYGNQSGQLEYDFVVAPGADPNVISINVGAVREPPSPLRNGGLVPDKSARGQEPTKRAVHEPPLRLDPNGDLVLHSDGGEIRLQKPVVYQEPSTVDSSQLTAKDETRHLPLATRHFLDGHYSLDAQNRIGFMVGGYDHSKPLVIDPAIAYSTLLGGTTGPTYARAIATYTDSSTGTVYAYVAGYTCASDFPTANPLHTYGGACDGFVTKFDPAASGPASVVFSTYLGGGGGAGIAVDSAGNAYVTGSTSSINFPTSNAYQATLKGGADAILTKLNADGSMLLYSTFFGGSGSDGASAIALDSAGRAYIAGGTSSPDLPTVNPYQAFRGSLYTGNYTQNAFVAVLDTTKSGVASLVYATFLGGSGFEYYGDDALAVAVDTVGGIHVAGSTASQNFPTANGFQGCNTGQGAFYTKLNPLLSGSAQLVYSTCLGGVNPYDVIHDTAQGIAVDPAGNAYLTGSAFSGIFPTTPGAFQTQEVGLQPWVAKINPSLAGSASLIYSTFLGQGPPQWGHDSGNAVAVDSTGNAFVTGSAGPEIPLVNPVMGSTNGAFQSFNAGQTWTGLTQGLTEFPISALAVDASTSPRTLYAASAGGEFATDAGVFASTDGGLNWTEVFHLSSPATPGFCNNGSTGPCIFALAIDPTTPSKVYVGTNEGVFKSSDRGATWSALNTGLTSTAVQQGVEGLTFDVTEIGGTVYATLYAGAPDGLYVLSPGAVSWSTTGLTGVEVQHIAIDPATTPHTIYTGSAGFSTFYGNSSGGSFRSTDGGTAWTEIAQYNASPQFSDIAVDDSTSPATLFGYSIFPFGPYVWSSSDGGNTWNPLPSDPRVYGDGVPETIVLDTSTRPSTLYVQDPFNGIFRSADSGNTWSNVLSAGMGAIALDPTTAGPTPPTIYAATGAPLGNAYVAELNPSGSALLFSSYLGGIEEVNTLGFAIALDASDNIYVTGQTTSPYFPTVNAFQATAVPGSGSIGFFTKLGSQTLPENSSGSVSTQVVVPNGTLAITFPSITGSTTSSPPTLTVTPLSTASTANFSLSNNLGAYDISTTAEFTASSSNPVTLCFQALTVNDFSTFSNLKILHIVNGSPVNVTTSYNFSTRTICGAVTSFSPFVLVKGPADQLNDLVRSVNESDTRHGIQNSLDAKLQNALSALNSARNNSYSTVCNVMGAFISNVTAQEGNAITVGEATAFISAAKQIKATLGCQ